MSADPSKNFWGEPCVQGHTNEAGLTLRNIRNRRCLVCSRERLAKSRAENPESYKEYQRAYHQKMRAENPDRLYEYYLRRPT